MGKNENKFSPPPLPEKHFIPPSLPQEKNKILIGLKIISVLLIIITLAFVIKYVFNKNTELSDLDERDYSSVGSYLKDGEVGLRDEYGNEYGAQIDEDYYFGNNTIDSSSISDSSNSINPEENSKKILEEWYCVRSDFEKEYRPRLILYKDNSFKMIVNLLECMSEATGTYTIKDGIIYCRVKSKGFEYGFTGSELTEYVFRINNGTLMYEGNMLGATCTGDIFMRQ